jgi:hypothetical protein
MLMNNFVQRTRAGRNSLISFAITFFVDIVLWLSTFLLDYFMGKVFEEWLKNNASTISKVLNWLIENHLYFSIIIFLFFLGTLMYLDWKKFENSNIKPLESNFTVSQNHNGKGNNQLAESISNNINKEVSFSVDKNEGMIIGKNEGDIYFGVKKKTSKRKK